MDPTRRFIMESGMLVVGFGAIGVVMVLGGMSAGAAVPLVLLFAMICWVATMLVPWRRAVRAARAERREADTREPGR